MADAGGDVFSVICGGFCLVIFSGLTAFCGTKRYGAGSGSGGSAGCCGSCCKASFDEDAFDAEVKKDMEKTRDPNAQPVLKAPMAVEKAPSEEGEGKTAASTTAVTATGTS